MKQRIEPEQLAELNEEQKEHLRELWEPKFGDVVYIHNISYEAAIDRAWLLIVKNKNKKDYLPLLSIGQCIKITKDNSPAIEIETKWRDLKDEWYIDWGKGDAEAKELIDALWEAVKEVL